MGVSFLLLYIFCGSLSFPPAQDRAVKNCPSLPDKVPTVNFCDVVRNPARYDRKIVRLKASFLAGFEERIVFDKECKGEAWVEFDYFYDVCTVKSLQDSLWNHRCPEGKSVDWCVSKSEITAIGLVAVDENGFGHMNDYKLEFTIKKLEKVTPVRK